MYVSDYGVLYRVSKKAYREYLRNVHRGVAISDLQYRAKRLGGVTDITEMNGERAAEELESAIRRGVGTIKRHP